MPAQPAPPPGLILRYVDRTEISETFVDSLEKIFIDQSTLRLEFVVNRFDEPKPPAPPPGRKITACRVVMPIAGFFEMIGKLNGLMQQMQQQGIIRPIHPGAGPGSKPS